MDRLQRFYGLYVDGDYRPAHSGNVFAVENPRDRSLVGEVAEGDAADIERPGCRGPRAAALVLAVRRATRRSACTAQPTS